MVSFGIGSFGRFVICLPCFLHSAWPSCSLQPFYTLDNWQFAELIVHVAHYFRVTPQFAQNTTSFCRIGNGSCHAWAMWNFKGQIFCCLFQISFCPWLLCFPGQVCDAILSNKSTGAGAWALDMTNAGGWPNRHGWNWGSYDVALHNGHATARTPCDMSMCISTAQPRTKSAPNSWAAAFFPVYFRIKLVTLPLPCAFRLRKPRTKRVAQAHEMLLVTCPGAFPLRKLAQNIRRMPTFDSMPNMFVDKSQHSFVGKPEPARSDVVVRNI